MTITARPPRPRAHPLLVLIAGPYMSGTDGDPGRIAANPPRVLRWTRQLLQQARTGTLDEALDAAGRLQGQAHHTADHAVAVAAFFEKRAPRFTGDAT
jgi:hypothetical protein